METLHIDFETFSKMDLLACGLDNYSSHISTGVHCLGFAFDDNEVEIWTENNSIDITRVLNHVRKGGEVVAHNATFELNIWNKICVSKYEWPELKVEQTRCTMAQAYAMALPGALEAVAAALGLEQQKNMAGARVMMQLAKPKTNGTLWKLSDDPTKFKILHEYCKQDVEVERAVDKRLKRLSDAERELWILDYEINRRGVQVDIKSIDKAIKLVESEKTRLNNEMLKVTEGVVGKCTEVQLLVKWIKSQGVELTGLAKSNVIDALNMDNLPSAVKKALLLRQEAAKSSTAKLTAMRDRANESGRVQGTLQYHGASTGRWAGRGIQVQNFPRPRKDIKPQHAEDIINHLDCRDYIDILYGPVLDAMSDCLRGLITASPNHELIAMDFSAIEARVLAWLAGEDRVIEIFSTHGKIYEHAAAGIYGVQMEDVNKEQRQIGKVAVLALGYGGGVGAFQSMARAYGVKVKDEQAEDIKKAWRKAHPNIVKYWYDLERASINATLYGDIHKAGYRGREIAFKKKGSFLWCRLPSGRVICYPYPVVKQAKTAWGEMKEALHFMTVNGTTKKWEETSTYGGSLAENVTQAVSACLLREALPRLEKEGFHVVFHAHDEVVVEVENNADEGVIRKVEEILIEQPKWAKGLPLSAEGWKSNRYRK